VPGDRGPQVADPGLSAEPGRTLGRLALLTLAHAFGTLNFMAVVAMAPVIQAALGLSRAEVGLFATVYYGGLFAGSLPLGWVVDRFGVRATLVAGHLVMAIASALLGQAGGFGGAAACLLLAGLGYAALNPATAKGILLWIPERERATAMGIKQTGVPIGGAVAAGAGALAAALGWRSVLGIVAGLIAAGGALCLLLPESRRDRGVGAGGRALADLGEVLANRNLAVFNLATGVLTAAQLSVFTYLTLFVQEATGAGLAFASLCLAAAHAGSMAGRIGWGLASDRWLDGRRKTAIVLIGLAASAFLAALAGVGPGGGTALPLGLALGLGLTIASHAGLGQAAAVEAVAPRLGGAAIGYNMLLTPVGAMLGPPLFGGLVDRSGSYAVGWLVAAAVVLAGTLILAAAFTERRR